MNPFVNPKKRDFLLPKGCKDLSDLLKGSKPRRPSPSGFRPESKHGSIVDVEKHVRQFLSVEELTAFLSVISPKPDCDLSLSVAESQILLHVTALEGEQEAAVRAFSSRRGLESLHDETSSGVTLPFFPGARVYQTFDYLLPKDVEQITRIIREFLHEIHGVAANTDLIFIHSVIPSQGDEQ